MERDIDTDRTFDRDPNLNLDRKEIKHSTTSGEGSNFLGTSGEDIELKGDIVVTLSEVEILINIQPKRTKMTGGPTFRLQKRLAADVMDCGKGRVWFDPAELSEIAQASSRNSIRKLVKSGIIIRKPITSRSRYNWRVRREAKQKGRHMGIGKRFGTMNARNPVRLQWLNRMRVERKLLKKYRDNGKIDKSLYRELYLKVKGNVFKSKRQLMEHVFKAKAELIREQRIQEQLKIKKEKQEKIRVKRAEKSESKKKKVIDQAEKAAQQQKKE
ncbi:hypothetical protein ABK040_012943 [Willaertia magna]